MSLLKSVLRFGVCGAIVLASACHHKPRHRRDASTDPVGGGDAGSCDSDAASGTCGNGIFINARLNACPRAAFGATPTQVRLEEPILVNSRTVDPEGDPLTFEWSAEPDGKFDDSASPATYYRCESLGRKTLRLEIGDDYDCASVVEGEVNCVDVDAFLRSGAQTLPSMP